MIGLRLTFTAGRYHATSWAHHVNEGVAEWPPAPWRILRALVAASYRLDDADRAATVELVEILTALPVYRLPPSSTAHLRHYMPTDDTSVKVLDTFVVIGRGAQSPEDVLVWWPGVGLSVDQRELLERLVVQIGYLGRAESWVDVAVENMSDLHPNAFPAAFDAPKTSNNTVRLLAAQSSDALAWWRDRIADELTSGQKRSTIQLPASVWEALNVDTDAMQREGWSQAPGSCWVDYQVNEHPRTRALRRVATRGPQGVLFALDSVVLPTDDRTLIVAERLRSALMGARTLGPSPWQLSGKGEFGQPLEGHRHAYFLPIAGQSRDGRTLIDRVLVWTDEGFEADAWKYIQARATGTKPLQLRGDSDHTVHAVLAGYGDFRELAGLVGSNVLGPSRCWVSETPFIAPRFTKRRRRGLVDTPADQLRWLCREVLGCEAEVEEVSPPGGAFGWNRFVRYRRKDREPMAGRPGSGFRITFASEVQGPIALGYGAHFGLGRFRPHP